MTLGVKKVSKPFSILELCTIVREHDADKADELRDRFGDYTLNNFSVAWTLNTVTIGGDLVVKLPISYGNLRKAKYDESIVLAFAKTLLMVLPTVNESKELVATWGAGEYEKHSVAEIVSALGKPSLRKRIVALFKAEDDHLHALTALESYREIGTALLKDTEEMNHFVDPSYTVDYAFTLVGLAKSGVLPGDNVAKVVQNLLPGGSLGNIVCSLLEPLQKDGGAYGLVLEDVSSSFGVHADSFRGGLDCRPCSWFMRLLMAHYRTKTHSTMEVLGFAPTTLDVEKPMGYLVLPPSDIRDLADTVMNAKKGAYRSFTDSVDITRLAALVFSSHPTHSTEVDYLMCRTITELLAEVSAKQMIKFSNDGCQLRFTYHVRTAVKGGIEVRLLVEAKGKGTQCYTTTGLGLSGFFKIMDIFRPYGSYNSNDPFTNYAASCGVDFQETHLGGCSALVPLKASTEGRYVKEQKFWAKIVDPKASPQLDVKDGKHLMALYRENLIHTDEFGLAPIPELFDENWIDFTKLPKEPVNPTNMSDDEIMDELFGAPKHKPVTVGYDLAAEGTHDSSATPPVPQSFKQSVSAFPSSQLVEPSGFAATLPLEGAFSMAVTPPDSHIGEEIGQYMKPSNHGNPYYRVLQVHETTSSKSVVGVRLQNKMLSFRVKGEICNRLQGELLKMCFKKHGDYMSIHLEVHDMLAVIAMTNTILGRLVESGVKVHTIFLAQG